MSTVSTSWAALVGDPTPRGWVTLFAYLLVAWMCWRARVVGGASAAARSEGWLWALLALLFFVLGLNKQLDLQTALIHAGRAIARSRGIAVSRGEASVYFMVALGASGAIGLYVLLRLSWPPSPGLALALAGLACLLAFVLLRFSAFQRVPLFVGAQVLRWSWLLELACIGLAGAGAALRLRKRAPTPG